MNELSISDKSEINFDDPSLSSLGYKNYKVCDQACGLLDSYLRSLVKAKKFTSNVYNPLTDFYEMKPDERDILISNVIQFWNNNKLQLSSLLRNDKKYFMRPLLEVIKHTITP
jgi:hypothetical protein